MVSLTRRFAELWIGCRKDVFGIFRPDGTRKGAKVGGRAKTVREALVDAVWENHLNGAAPIGCIPISPPDTCMWGAIDIDDYEFDHTAFSALIKRLRPSLNHCRSKSGGCHVYVFMKEPIAAEDMRKQLERLAAELGYKGSEIFPKQVLVSETEVGNWINLPYADYKKTTRYCIDHETGESMTLEDFIEQVNRRRLTLNQLEKVSLIVEKPVEKAQEDPWYGAPPCLMAMSAAGVGEGRRNDFLYAVGTYLKKRYPNNWHEALPLYNQKLCKPPVDEGELTTILRSLKTAAYYSCKTEPLRSFCNSKLCVTRKYGVGDATLEFPEIVALNILRTEPAPRYFMYLAGYLDKPIELSDNDLMKPIQFRQKVMRTVDWRPGPISEAMLGELLAPFLGSGENNRLGEYPMAEEDVLFSGPRGAMFGLLQKYLNDRMLSEDADDLLAHNPVTLDGGKTITFTIDGFKEYLRKHQFRELAESAVYTALRQASVIWGGRVRTTDRQIAVRYIETTDLMDPKILMSKSKGFKDENRTNSGTARNG